MAYLGRISAVLTAQTRDFSRAIGESRRELQNFAQQARGIKFNLDARGLDRVLTDVQRINRAIQEIRNQRALGVDAGLPDPGRLRDLYRAYQDIGKPLTALKTQIEGLATSMQSQLAPELDRVTGGWLNLYRSIDNGTATFDGQARAIENLRLRLVNLRNATSALSDLGTLTKTLNASNVGASFFQPRVKEALQQTISLRNDAQKIPARFRNSTAFAQLSADAEQNADAIEEAAARVARANLAIQNTRNPTPRMLEDRGIAQGNLDALTRRQELINRSFNREIRSATIEQIVSPQAASQVDSLTERFAKLSASLRDTNSTKFDPLIASVGGVIEQLNRGEVSARRAKQAVDALAGVDFSRSFARSGFKDADQILRTDTERRIAEIRRNAAAERRNVIGSVGALSLVGPDRMRAIEGINRRETISLDREAFNRRISEQIPDLSSRVKDLKSDQLSKQFDDIRSLARDASRSLRDAFKESDPTKQQAGVDAYKLKIASLTSEIAKFEQRVKSAETANRRFDQFLQISGSRGDKLGASLTRFASDIAVTRQLAGNFSSQNVSGRAAVERQIERNLRFAENQARAQQQLADNTSISEAERQRRRQLLDQAVERKREENKNALVNASGGTLSAGRAQSAMDRAAKNQGSIGIGGIAAAQLAFQQGLFAIDDFISATGGLEYKLRAIGNNITQLGLLLGQSGLIPGLSALGGLAVGLGVVLGGQLLTAFLKFATGAEEADAQIKALNDSLSKQKNLADQVAKSFESIGESISRKAFSGALAEAKSFQKVIDDFEKEQKKARTETLVGTNRDVQRERGLQEVLRKRLETADDAGTRALLNSQIQQSRRRELLGTRAATAVAARISDADISGALADNIRAIGAARARDAASSRRNALFPFLVTSESGVRTQTEQRVGEFLGRGLSGELLRTELANEIRRLRQPGVSTASRFSGFGFSTDEQRANAERLGILTNLQNQIRFQDTSNPVSSAFLQSLNAAANEIQAAQNQVVEAVRAGIPAATLLDGRIETLANQIDDAQKAIAAANEKLQNEDITLADRDKIVQEQQGIIDRASASRQRAIAEADQLTRQRIVDPQELFDARRRRAEENLQAAGLENGGIARQIRVLEAQREAIRNRISQAPESQRAAVQQQAAAEEVAINQQMAALEGSTIALRRFADELDRASSEAQGNLQASQQRADDLRRASLAPGVGLAMPDVMERVRASVEQERQKQIAQELEDAVAKARIRAEEQVDPNGRLQQIEETARAGRLTPDLIDERRRLNREIDNVVQLDQDVEKIRNRSTESNERALAVERGLDLAMTERERLQRDVARQAADIEAARSGGNINNDQANEAFNRLLESRAQQAAPLLMGFREERLNAVLQGPSRAALNVADAQTADGARELNRLLRGDDPAKDVNLVELQKQSDLLQGVIDAIKEQGPNAVIEMKG